MRYILSNFSQFVKVLTGWIKSKIIFILLVFLAFGSGIVLGGRFLQRPPITIEGDVIDIGDLKMVNTAQKALETTNAKSIEMGGFVASSRGKYYYPAGCSLAKNLSPANLLNFETEQQAVDAGYIRQEKCY